MSLVGSTIRLGNYSPNATTQVSVNSQAVVSATAVEFADISQYDIPTDSRGMVNADIDLTADQLTYTIDDDFYTNFLAGQFTGPILQNLTPGGPVFYTASIDTANNSFGLQASDVTVVGGRLMINLQGTFFDDGDSFTLNLGFIYRGTNAGESIIGTTYNDRLVGYGGNDFLSGGRGLDRLVGGNGSDYLDGRAGGDMMAGGNGNDRYYTDNPNDRVVEGANAGIDTIFAADARTLSANVENITLTGTAAWAAGNTLANTIRGNALSNTLNGAGGNDWIYGGAGDDRIIGGGGVDHLVGDAGIDTFVFTVGAGRDFIHAYESGVDIVDVSAIDANSAVAGDQAFTWRGAAAFTGNAGELHYTGGVLSGDVNGDGVGDFSIQIVNNAPLTPADLIL